MPWLNLNGKQFSLDQLLSESDRGGFTSFEKTTFQFCKAWLSGQREFTIQTSGSTGTPKTITLQRSQMEASAKQTIKALRLQAGETSLVCLDTQYIAGQMMLVRSLIAKMNIVAVEPSSNPLNEIKPQQIDFVALVPYQLENILTTTPEKMDAVRCAIIGGAAMHHFLIEKVKSNHCEIFATYGMTETLSHIALQQLSGSNAKDYFEAFPSIDLRLDDRGCLCIRAEYLDEEIITNDLVELLANNKFKWLGRIDNVINSGGIKIIPEKVESVFERIFDQLQIKNRFFITGHPNEKLGQQVTLIVEGTSLDQSVQERIMSEAINHLSKYEIAKAVISINRFQQTATGKINRPATLALLQ